MCVGSVCVWELLVATGCLQLFVVVWVYWYGDIVVAIVGREHGPIKHKP